MKYVDKSIALKYLAGNENIFNKVKNSFISSYKNAIASINQMCEEHNLDELYRYVHSIKGVSLNIGSMILYDDCNDVLEKMKKESNKIPSLEQFINTLQNVCLELEQL